jgi:hypothetical protein
VSWENESKPNPKLAEGQIHLKKAEINKVQTKKIV